MSSPVLSLAFNRRNLRRLCLGLREPDPLCNMLGPFLHRQVGTVQEARRTPNAATAAMLGGVAAG
jgi:hypothetical protein